MSGVVGATVSCGSDSELSGGSDRELSDKSDDKSIVS